MRKYYLFVFSFIELAIAFWCVETGRSQLAQTSVIISVVFMTGQAILNEMRKGRKEIEKQIQRHDEPQERNEA